jgi:tetratricopeptide (TPR) repeat protein
MTATPDEATADLSARCEEARRSAESGDLDRAATLFQEVLALGDTPYRAVAALGLAVVRADAGDHAGARAADEIAIATGDREYGSRAAYHLALSHERAEDLERAREAWERVVEFGNPDYLPPACFALAQLADDAGDFPTARQWWERAINASDAEDPHDAHDAHDPHDSHDPHDQPDQPDSAERGAGAASYALAAAHELAQRLLERGEPGEALRVMERARHAGRDPRLAVTSGMAHLDLAVQALYSATRAGDPEVSPLAIELLARILPLRGRVDEAGEVWRRGLTDEDPGIVADVRERLRRDLAPADTEVWWDPVLEAAIGDGAAPALADEALAALDQMYVLAAMRYAEGQGDLPIEAYDLLAQVVRVPSDFPWGSALHASFAARLRGAMGTDEEVLPATWPDVEP